MRDVLKVVKLDNLVLLREFQNFCFGLLGTATHDEFSKKVINFQSHDDRFTANFIINDITHKTKSKSKQK